MKLKTNDDVYIYECPYVFKGTVTEQKDEKPWPTYQVDLGEEEKVFRDGKLFRRNAEGIKLLKESIEDDVAELNFYLKLLEDKKI